LPTAIECRRCPICGAPREQPVLLEEPFHCRGMNGLRAGIEVAGRPRLRIAHTMAPMLAALVRQSCTTGGGHTHRVRAANAETARGPQPGFRLSAISATQTGLKPVQIEAKPLLGRNQTAIDSIRQSL
jgi:hypothetical protein